MNLLLVSQYFWPENFRINDLIRSCHARGISIDVLTGKPNYPEGSVFAGYQASGCSRENWNGAELFRVPLFLRGKSSGLRLALNYLSFIMSGLIFAPWMLRGRSADVVFVFALSPLLQAFPAILLARIKGAPLVIWVQDLWPESLEATGHVKNRLILRLVKECVRFIYRRADLILVQSKAFIPEVSSIAPDSRIVYYPTSVEKLFLSGNNAEAADIPELKSGFPVLFAGNIGRAQAVDVIVDAAERLRDHPDIKFVVVGDGSRLEWLRQQVATRGLENLHLPGRFPVEDMPSMMTSASALLVTLTDRNIFNLTVPAKIQSYMAVGRPIIACLNGEGARLVDEAGAGISVPAENGSALAEAVLRLYEMTEADRVCLGENGRQYFEQNFHLDRLTDQLIGHLQETIDRGKVKQ